jgi:transposase
METKKYRRCCGIDVHKKNVTVCILAPVGKAEVEIRRRTFRTFTRDLKQLRTWLKNCKVTEIAMESTGQYWRAVWNILEEHFEKLILVNPMHIKGLAGHKTDPKDAQWIASLLETGKLKGSLVPPREIRELRDLTRQRVNLLEDLNRAKNRIEQLCQAGNIKISSVASDLFGLSGRTMLKALVEGRRDPGWMADYARGSLPGKRRELELALEGSFTENQRWLLGKELNQVEWLELQVQVLEQEIQRRMVAFEEPMRRVMTIRGIEYKTAWTIIAEIGVDMGAFEDAQHLASWAGLCPGNRESGGKRMSGRTRKANRYVRRAMCQAAWAAAHTQNTFLSAFYRRMQIRKRTAEGGDGAGTPHDLMKLGYQVTLTPVAPEESVELPSEPPASVESAFEFRPDLMPEEELPAQKPKRGRPCKCAERGIVCKHKIGLRLNLLETQGLSQLNFRKTRRWRSTSLQTLSGNPMSSHARSPKGHEFRTGTPGWGGPAYGGFDCRNG